MNQFLKILFAVSSRKIVNPFFYFKLSKLTLCL
uniref:Uncharacterized protein n=1 Tax=Rhizophora mucronata TaxID=61149 RepID=A0A2P2IHU6_RHIMU